ncbi:PREDICTED: vesicle transport through interaction with t-SNAREs homolog 1A-like [Amphimedon queenslandica]|uniref:Vesicle transport through interaction with t-SNAREs homolog 1A n=1 Tax=Amphimedon queenslandica TaxID=400682 RepID=A0A1X7VUE8_AMPQE|nr:PREDICTED: vesicle transport through interaction with t-SNAREs homolog 1A-like [Amphimedon queenslandica]|eukprot:XP_003382490.1 PREDICTED: vesicle transport through interaction with t-SNAREs homolog 1A-like [Amphimedon queenslandica]
MSSVFESYEGQFSTITADITARIGKIPNLIGTEKKTAIGVVQGNIDEAGELLDQMDLEIHDVPQDNRGAAKKRLTSYKHELERLKKEFRQSQVALGDETSMRKELFDREELYTSEDHRARLLDNTERLAKTSDTLEDGYRIAKETETIGLDIIDNLQGDRDTINRIRGRLRDTDSEISKGGRVIRRIGRRIVQHKIILAVVILVILVIIGLLIFGIVKIHQKTSSK